LSHDSTAGTGGATISVNRNEVVAAWEGSDVNVVILMRNSVKLEDFGNRLKLESDPAVVDSVPEGWVGCYCGRRGGNRLVVMGADSVIYKFGSFRRWRTQSWKEHSLRARASMGGTQQGCWS
jgi:hypothetical protein